MQTTAACEPTLSIEDHLPLVRRVAKRMARRLPQAVDIDDLIAAGTIGLLDAAGRFDPLRASSFASYAEFRVRGAILDHLREMDWLPRALRAEDRRNAEAARRDGVPAAEARAVVSVEDVRSDGFDAFADQLALPADALESRERKARLADAVRRLSPRSQQLLALYYVEEITLKEIGAIFGITESRACQLHGQAITKLRAQLVDG